MARVPTDHSNRIARIDRACLTLDQLHEETRLLYESITANARSARADATKQKRPKPRKR